LELVLALTTYKIFISYNGQGFEGWQIQPAPKKTIQGELNKALSKITKSSEIKSMGSGRTDSGVHALSQVVKIELPLNIDTDGLKNALNSHLTRKIRVLSCELCDEAFHVVKDAKSKCYRYLLYEADELPPFLEGKVTLIRPGVNWGAIEAAMKEFVGVHDFINFSTKGTPVLTTTREILSAEFYENELDSLGQVTLSGSNFRELRFVGTGFLKQMVRLIVGALISVGQDKVTAESIRDYLSAPKSDKVGPVAPADGLYLDHVTY
jgi:tRNA pseudouridine38-40 synthase